MPIKPVTIERRHTADLTVFATIGADGVVRSGIRLSGQDMAADAAQTYAAGITKAAKESERLAALAAQLMQEYGNG
jgi:hypothetical protein